MKSSYSTAHFLLTQFSRIHLIYLNIVHTDLNKWLKVNKTVYYGKRCLLNFIKESDILANI